MPANLHRPLTALITAFAITAALSGAAVGTELSADGGFAATPYRSPGCESDLGLLNQVSGWQTAWPREWMRAATLGPQEQRDAIERWKEAPDAIAATTRSLRASIGTNRVAPKPVVRRVLQQVDGISEALATKAVPASEEGSAWQLFVEESLRPALDAYRELLRDAYLPATNDRLDLATLTGNDRCYAEAIEWWTSLDLTSAEVEAIGRTQLDDTLVDLQSTLGDDESLDELLAAFRSGEAFGKVERRDIVTVSEEAIQRAQAAAGDWFERGFSAPIVVEAIPAQLEDSVPAGFYRAGSPGTYAVNLSRPSSRRAMAEVIAFHEAVPGHHLQFSYAEANGSFSAGFAEGWAIYAEYLADEMGLFSSTRDRQGMMTKHLWSASRLIVEPGLQAHGWTREQAIAFMLDNTALARAEIEIEVDRYIAMPGQSLSYTLGYAYLQNLRDHAEDALAEAFSIRQFHDVVLDGGMRPLDTVAQDVRAWIERISAGS
ncbi:MAG: DUF885 domain-containing protein [Pseudomonadota bacterium]